MLDSFVILRFKERYIYIYDLIIGEEPTLRGFYHGCGFNSAGMMFGGGCGWQLVLRIFLPLVNIYFIHFLTVFYFRRSGLYKVALTLICLATTYDGFLQIWRETQTGSNNAAMKRMPKTIPSSIQTMNRWLHEKWKHPPSSLCWRKLDACFKRDTVGNDQDGLQLPALLQFNLTIGTELTVTQKIPINRMKTDWKKIIRSVSQTTTQLWVVLI